jgi:carbamoyl-phosphate synthase large subunit
MVNLATRVMLGQRLANLGWASGLVPARPLVAVKAPVFSMSKLSAVDSYLGPEMKSTGEVMGVDRTLAAALAKAFQAAGMTLPKGGRALLTIADADKPEMFPIVSRLTQLGYQVLATSGTAAALRRAGFSPQEVGKIGEGNRSVVDVISAGDVDLVINTMSGTNGTNGAATAGLPVMKDGFEIRRAAVERRIPCLTSLDTAAALLESAVTVAQDFEVRTITEWRQGVA